MERPPQQHHEVITVSQNNKRSECVIAVYCLKKKKNISGFTLGRGNRPPSFCYEYR